MRNLWRRLALALVAATLLAARAGDVAPAGDVRLALLLLVRDEAALLKEHLPAWVPLAWCSVAGVDERTSDLSHRAYRCPARKILCGAR